jgi:pseudaminic acid cytidylyltransferase
MNICIIPARGGSKRIPRKNIKNFLGKPIIAYSIEAALASNCFDQVIVSTDDEEIAEVARKWGAEVPFLRPKALADDHAGTVVVIQHAVQWLRDDGRIVENVCCLHATAPFVIPEYLRLGLELLEENDVDYVFSAAEFESPFQRAFKLTNSGCIEMFYPEHLDSRSQDLERAFYNAGQFYWGKGLAWEEGKRVFTSRSKPMIMQRGRSHDIDTIDDWEYAETIFKCMP